MGATDWAAGAWAFAPAGAVTAAARTKATLKDFVVFMVAYLKKGLLQTKNRAQNSPRQTYGGYYDQGLRLNEATDSGFLLAPTDPVTDVERVLNPEPDHVRSNRSSR